ncbi:MULTISPECIES: hypothetical protein [Pontibacillus]|uniref:Uncharacterized protein n=1 Tax=Pontibacillus chungwhensis TaxID=265426 RepID=A0ABY8UVI1_9BACI|nr:MULTISPECIES: hypothetical protein [Pontibacillus]MCD5324264.1 hypothetical protein [Pontibacillus sp. HN14]WIF97682.1 hypothetical protein QNI29_18435 [Pontibacillus chungwhensis]
MNAFTDSIKNWAKDTAGKVKQRLEDHAAYSKMKVEDLAKMVLNHEGTSHMRHEYIGVVLHDYHLRLGDTDLLLETKGDQSLYILECKVVQKGHVIGQFQSWDPKMNVLDSLRVPAFIKEGRE